MTAYFDKVNTEISEAMATYREVGDTFALAEVLDQIELRVVHDCTLASSASRFPPDLRLSVHRACLRYGVRTLPPNAVPADFETEDEHARRIRWMASDLHDVFHALAHRNIPGYTDSPWTVVQSEWIYPRDLERELIAHTEFGGVHPEEYAKRILGNAEQGDRNG